MLMARNADICTKCLVTEPVVRSFINLQISYADSPGTYNAPRGANVLFYAARVNLLQVRDQVCVLPFSSFLHWALNFAYCAGVRTDFADSMYLVSLASEQPAF